MTQARGRQERDADRLPFRAEAQGFVAGELMARACVWDQEGLHWLRGQLRL